MATSCTTTPSGVFKSLPTSRNSLWTSAAGLTAFDRCLSLARAAVEADADVAGWHQDPALALFDAAAADAAATAITALAAFCVDGADGSDLTDAAEVMLHLFEDDGARLDGIAAKNTRTRRASSAYAAMPHPLGVAVGSRLIAAADLIDELIEAALDDEMATDTDPFGDLYGSRDRHDEDAGETAPALSDLSLSIPDFDLA